MFCARRSQSLFVCARSFSTAPPPHPNASSGSPARSSGLSTRQWVTLGVVPLAVAGGAYYFSTSRQKEVQAKIAEKKAKKSPLPALDPQIFKEFKLQEVIPINHNTSRFRFSLPEGTDLDLPIASCVVTKFTPSDSDKPVIRPYTPVEDQPKEGTFDLIVKKYPNGPMSTRFYSLKPGESLEVKGPIPKWEYKPNEFKHVGLIAGGTGITPMLQIINKVLSDPADNTKLSLIFANVTEDDILLKNYLDDLTKTGKVDVFYTVDKPSSSWKGGKGYVNEDTIKKLMPKPGNGKVFVCGPAPMVAHISGSKAKDYTQGEIGGLLKKLGYTEADVFKF